MVELNVVVERLDLKDNAHNSLSFGLATDAGRMIDWIYIVWLWI